MKKKKKVNGIKKFYFLKQQVLREINTLSHDEVLPKLEALHKEDPNDVDVLKALAFINIHKQKYGMAMNYVLSVLGKNPDDAKALEYKAWIYDETGDDKSYIETLEKIILIGKANWEIYSQMAEAQQKNGDYFKALTCYIAALKDPNNDNPFYAAINSANCYSEVGAYGIADEIYDTLLDVYPGDLLILHNKAGNYNDQGKLVEAEKILQEVISKDPTFTASVILLAEIHQKLISTTPQIPIMNNAIGPKVKLIFTHENEELKKLWDEINDLIAQRNFYEAKQKLEAIIKIDDSKDFVWLTFAHIHLQLIEPQEAIECSDNVLQLAEQNNVQMINFALTIKANALFALGDLDNALAIVDNLISTDPNDYKYVLLKARILNRKGDYSGAIKILLPAMTTIPPGTEIAGFANYLLAVAYYKLGDNSKHMKYLTKSTRLGCEFGTRLYSVRRQVKKNNGKN